MKYLLLAPDTEEPPDISDLRPFRSLVVVEESVTSNWQEKISNWLVNSGCLYMMAWGQNPSSWDDSVDYANLKAWDFRDIPEDSFVLTTWHQEETLEEVLEFAKYIAKHPSVSIKNTLLVHISKSSKEANFLDIYKRL